MEAGSLGMLAIYASAFSLGVLHSLEPGHGKTVVAAYLVGSRGSNADALLLGLVVTFTHTFSIMILGVLAKISSRHFPEKTMHAFLGLLSSLLILSLGIWMIWKRWKELRVAGHGSLLHDHGEGAHAHGHMHNHVHKGLSSHDGVGLGSLVLLGISGGIIPCPAALAILLTSAVVGKIGSGFALVVTFSGGLAVALVTIGLLVVNGMRFGQRFFNAERLAPRAALASAVIVSLVGVFALHSSLRHFGLV